MRNTKNITELILETIIFSVSGGVFAGLAFGIEDYLTRSRIETSGFAVDYVQETVGLLWVVLGLGISYIFWNFLFRKTAKYFFIKWFLVLITSTLISVLMQLTFLIYNHDMTLREIISAHFPHNIQYLLGFSRMLNLFKILFPFTFLFATFLFIFKRRQNQNLLK